MTSTSNGSALIAERNIKTSYFRSGLELAPGPRYLMAILEKWRFFKSLILFQSEEASGNIPAQKQALTVVAGCFARFNIATSRVLIDSGAIGGTREADGKQLTPIVRWSLTQLHFLFSVKTMHLGWGQRSSSHQNRWCEKVL